MSQLEKITTRILENEHASDNYALAGIIASFLDPEDLMAFVSELNHGINGSLINRYTAEPIVYSDVNYF